MSRPTYDSPHWQAPEYDDREYMADEPERTGDDEEDER